MAEDTGAVARVDPFRPLLRRLLLALGGKPVHRDPLRRADDQACRQIPVVDTIVCGLRHEVPAIERGLELRGTPCNARFQLFFNGEQRLFCLPALFDFLLKTRFCTFQLDGALSENLPAPQRRPEGGNADAPVRNRPGNRNSRR